MSTRSAISAWVLMQRDAQQLFVAADDKAARFFTKKLANGPAESMLP